MNPEQAISMVILGIELSTKAGAYNLEQASEMFNAVQIIKQIKITVTPEHPPVPLKTAEEVIKKNAENGK